MDGICLISAMLMTPLSLQELWDLLVKVKHESGEMSLHLNVAKTNIMVIGKDVSVDSIMVENEEVEVVFKFNFLGHASTPTEDARTKSGDDWL